ncbi:MAG: hypothetical protein ACREME_12935 [Gemmatimonadales bacterium]
MWGPGTAPLSDFDRTLRIVDLQWDVGDTTGDIRSFDTFLGTLAFGGEIGAFSTGDFGLFTRFSNVGTGAVGVTYPVQVTVGVPDPNTFRDGQTIRIPTAVALLGGAAIATTPPHGAIDITASAALAAGAHTQVCIFGCTTFPLFPSVDFGLTGIQLLSMGVDAEGSAFAELLGLPARLTLPHELTFIESEITNLSGTIGLPSVAPVTAVQPDLRTLVAAGRDTFFNVALDMDGVVSPIPLGYETPDFHGAHLKYETVDISTVVKMYQDQTFSFAPTVLVTFVFPRPVVYGLEDAAGNTVASGTAATITFEAGLTLTVTYPSGLKEPMTIQPAFAIRNTFSSGVVNHFREDIVMTIGEFELSVPRTEIFPSVTADACHFATVTLDVANIIPDESCPVTTPAVHTPEISIDLGPLFQQSLFGLGQQVTMFPTAPGDCTPGSDGCGRWELQGFNTVTGDVFVLDPENPIIAVTTTIASGLATGTGPAGTLTQTIGVSNEGDVPLSAAQIADALAVAVVAGGDFDVEQITSLELTENAAFNGEADPSTLTRADVLAVGGSGTVTVRIGVTPGNVFTALLDADGTSPIGTTVRANASARFGVFAFDIIPSSQSAASQGDLPVVVLGSEGMDPADIDVSTVRLEGVAPLRSELVPRDGVNDLTLKFDRVSLLAAIEARLAATPTLAVAPAAPPAPSVAAPGLDPTVVAQALLGDRSILTPDQHRAADGNGNGVLDVGDLRALLAGRASEPAVILAMAAPSGGGGTGGASPNSEVSVTLVLTGMLGDGTPLMGEDLITIKYTGSGL